MLLSGFEPVYGVSQAFQVDIAKINILLRVEPLDDQVQRFSFNEPAWEALHIKIEEAALLEVRT